MVTENEEGAAGAMVQHATDSSKGKTRTPRGTLAGKLFSFLDLSLPKLDFLKIFFLKYTYIIL